MVLATVEDYVTSARRLLQDNVEPYRYDDVTYLEALNFGIVEARRLRPDLFIGVDGIPTYSDVDDTSVEFEGQFRIALLYFAMSHVLMHDDEETQDGRAVMFLQRFHNTLLTSGA